ncbi:AIPR family protein [Mucilaginibacter endophyticus]|uniref:AIPR family protein n=1 Tax=Mucilaginibacter endophyticus TaxID=2675003 RepID=UPI000E0D3EA2|nr:AIPR family protein [Mucilaginibacter endophyticus]
MKYETLINILERIRNEAPPKYRFYYPAEDDIEKLNQARSKAFIHLYLKVKFGLLDFEEREHFITDGANDGGIDGYFIDREERKIFFIQSKFRTNSKNFENKEITLSEILNMDTSEISEGNIKNEDGIEYNGKIKQLIREISSIEDIGKYNYHVIILANLKIDKPSKLKALTGGFPCTIFDFERCYNELIFPVVTGTFYNLSELAININLSDKGSSSKVSYKVKTEFKECNIAVLFVPTLEIAKILYKYKNSILKFNPRSYLDLASSTVNRAIRDTIVNRTTNEFALFNNGITILSDKTYYNENVGVKDRAQLTITNGQIINGGQTAYTLSLIYDLYVKEGKDPSTVLIDKEVLLKVITFDKDEPDTDKKLELIEAISKATNQQTEVTESDRRSNDKIQIEIQEKIFQEFGYYYERKRGEFGDGIRNKYIDRSMIINRDHFLRLCLSCDLKPAQARRNSETANFIQSNFENTLNDSSRYREYFYAYTCFKVLDEIQSALDRDSKNIQGELNYGNALRYGKYCVVSVASKFFDNKIASESFYEFADRSVREILGKWMSFEKHIENLNHNKIYFREMVDYENQQMRIELNYTGYYKGRTLNEDLINYFK